ncbi:hypothetical protein HDU98_004039, partial [Podochytrium sp. JEL0797]
HHLVLQRKPRSKKKIALLMRQQQLLLQTQKEVVNGDSIGGDVLCESRGVARLEVEKEIVATPSSGGEGESGSFVGSETRLASGGDGVDGDESIRTVETAASMREVQQAMSVVSPHPMEPTASMESLERIERGLEQVALRDESPLDGGDTKGALAPPTPAIPYILHSYNPAEQHLISKSANIALSISMLGEMNGFIRNEVGCEFAPPTRPASRGFSTPNNPTTEFHAARTVSLNSRQYDLAPSVIANLQVSLTRSP